MILVQLRQEELPFKLENEKHEGNLIVLTITDTGKGISSSYLRSQLFTPFAQENTLAPGTGLGLSIVKSIVTMLGGTIDIFSRTSGDRKSGSDEPASGLRRGSLSSNLGQGTGTEVQIRLPLSRLSSSDNTKSTNSSIISFDRIHDGSISKLQTLEAKKTMALFGFNEAVAPARIETRRVLEQYILEWFQLTYIPNWRDEHADIVILDEDDLTIFSNSYPKPSYTSAIILSAHLNRHEKPPVDCETFQYVSKPFGPFKLAKAVRIAVAKTRQGGGTPSPPPTAHTAAPAVFLPSPGLQNLTIGDAQDTIPVLAHSGSENAHIAMATPLEERRDNQTAQFPFPDQYIDESNTEKTESNPQQLTDGVKPEQSPAAEDGSLISETPKLGSPALKQPLVSAGLKGNPKLPLKTIQEAPLPTHLPSKSPVTAALPFRPKAPLVVAPNVVETPEAVEASSPKVLLVDDNSINLMLLETFMKKRKWVDIDKAENGLLAVQAAEVRQYSVIFMDISMPVLNGFDATRRIRAIEDQRRQDLKKQSPFSTLVDVKGNPIISKFKPALIIALTGLASSKDQSEALTCGMDLFMTKPVSFKEVGRLLDNWEVEAGKA